MFINERKLMVKIPIGELNMFFSSKYWEVHIKHFCHIWFAYSILFYDIIWTNSYLWIICSEAACVLESFFFKSKLSSPFSQLDSLSKKTAEAKADNMFKLKDNHLPRISMIYILLFLVCKMFTSWQHLIFIICLWNYSKHNNTYSLLIRLHSGHIFLFSFLNTYEICWRRSFVTKWTCQRLDVVSRFFKHQTSNRHDFSSVWSFHR